MCEKNIHDPVSPATQADAGEISLHVKLKALEVALCELMCAKLIVESRGGNLEPHQQAVSEILSRGEAVARTPLASLDEHLVDEILSDARELRSTIDRTAAIWLFMPKDSP